MDDYTKACGDGGCILRDRSEPNGQCTNGGCRHLKARGPEATKQLMALGAEVVRLRSQVGTIVDAWDGLCAANAGWTHDGPQATRDAVPPARDWLHAAIRTARGDE